MAAITFVRQACHAVVAMAAWSLVTAAQADTVVPGTSNPKLAGMPDGATAGNGGEGPDTAPSQSPVLFTEFSIAPGTWLQFTDVTGLVDNCGNGTVGACSFAGPDGSTLYANNAENGISGLTAPLNALVGVFLGADLPDAAATPANLSFEIADIGFTTLAPALQQVFFIGDGLTGTGSGDLQRFLVPDGATRLFLATHDAYGWRNNSGSFTVAVSAVPEPAGAALLLAGLGLLGVAARRRRG